MKPSSKEAPPGTWKGVAACGGVAGAPALATADLSAGGELWYPAFVRFMNEA